MANVKGLITKQQENKQVTNAPQAQKSLAVMFNDLLDQEGVRGRINELLGNRAPQFVGSLVSLVNTNSAMQAVFREAPVTIIQSALRAASYDLPIDSGLGYAYILPFKNKKDDGSYRNEAQFIMGYRGMLQLAMRTGLYMRLNVADIREGELVKFNPLTEDIELNWYGNPQQRAEKPIVGYCGYYRLLNGMEKYVYMSVEDIEKHERENRKGKFMNPVWRDNKDAMCRKTVLRQLIGKWGIMSIDYRTATPELLAFAENVAKNGFDDEDNVPKFETEVVTEDGHTVDVETGEIIFSADDVEEAVQG